MPGSRDAHPGTNAATPRRLTRPEAVALTLTASLGTVLCGFAAHRLLGEDAGNNATNDAALLATDSGAPVLTVELTDGAPSPMPRLVHAPDPDWLAAAGSADSPPAPERTASRTSDTHADAWYDDRPLRAVGTRRMTVTAYSPGERSCGDFADGVTASGMSVWTNGMRLVAADPGVLPLHSVVAVPGYDGNRPVPVLDVGSAIVGDRLDVLFATHDAAVAWGVRELDVVVYEYAD